MAQGRHTLMDPPIEELLDKVDSKFTLVALGSARARQVNSTTTAWARGWARSSRPRWRRCRASPCRSPSRRSPPARPPTPVRTPRRRRRWPPPSPTPPRPGLLGEGEASEGADVIEVARRRGRGPDRELGAGRRGAADTADGRTPGTEARRWTPPSSTAPGRPGRLRGHRRLQGRRGLPAPGRRRRARDAGADRRRHAVRRRGDVLRAGLRAGAAVAVGRGVAHPAHAARPERRPRSWWCRPRRTPSPATPPGCPTTS